jgi:hypothetical protein
MPINIYHQDIKGNPLMAECIYDIPLLNIAVGPIAGIPGAKGIARKHRDASREASVFLEGKGVVVSIAEEIPILLGGLRARLPPFLFDIPEGMRCIVKEEVAGAAEDAGRERREIVSGNAIKGSYRASQILLILISGTPNHLLVSDSPGYAQIISAKCPTSQFISEGHHLRSQHQPSILLPHLVIRFPPISLLNEDAWLINEFPLGRIFQSYKGGGDDGEASIVSYYLLSYPFYLYSRFSWGDYEGEKK